MKTKFDLTGASILWFVLVIANFSSDQYMIDQCLDLGLAFDYETFKCAPKHLVVDGVSYLEARYPRYLLITAGVVFWYYLRGYVFNRRKGVDEQSG